MALFSLQLFLCLNFLRLVFDVITLKYFEPFYGIEETIYTNNNFVSTLDIKELRFSFVVQCRIIEDIAMTLLLCSHPWPSWENLNILYGLKKYKYIRPQLHTDKFPFQCVTGVCNCFTHMTKTSQKSSKWRLDIKYDLHRA